MNSLLDKLKQNFFKHRFCYIFLGLFLSVFLQMIIVLVVTPIRCKMWEGKEIEVFLTPKEWRELSGVSELLKDTKWISYPILESKFIDTPFLIKNRNLYQPRMNFYGKEHRLRAINNKYPNINIYSYIYPENILGHNTFILYDKNLEKIIVQYNMILGSYENNILSGNFYCKENGVAEAYNLLENYLF